MEDKLCYCSDISPLQLFFVQSIEEVLCLFLPPSIFSSLLISITTNFSQTANVGRVEEMNWPNLRVDDSQCRWVRDSTKNHTQLKTVTWECTWAGRARWWSPAAADSTHCWWQRPSAATTWCLSVSAAIVESAEILAAVWHFLLPRWKRK